MQKAYLLTMGSKNLKNLTTVDSQISACGLSRLLLSLLPTLLLLLL